MRRPSPADKETVGGLPSVSKLEDDLQELIDKVDDLPGMMLEWAKADPLMADDKAHDYLLREIEPRIRTVTFNRLDDLPLLVIREEAFWPMLYESGSDGHALRAALKEGVLIAFGEATAHLSERGAEVAPIVASPKRAPDRLLPPPHTDGGTA